MSFDRAASRGDHPGHPAHRPIPLCGPAPVCDRRRPLHGAGGGPAVVYICRVIHVTTGADDPANEPSAAAVAATGAGSM